MHFQWTKFWNVCWQEVYFQKVFDRQSRVNSTIKGFAAFLVISVESVENWPVWKVNLKAGFFNVIDGEHFCFVMVKIVIITTATMNALNVFFLRFISIKIGITSKFKKNKTKNWLKFWQSTRGKMYCYMKRKLQTNWSSSPKSMKIW